MNIRIESLFKRYGKISVLDGVSLEIGSGTIVGLVGPNGAGKTTLLRTLATLVRAEKGRVLFDGAELSRERLDLRKRFFFLPDSPLMFGEMKVLRHIAMCLRLYGREGSERIARVIELLDEFDLLALAEARIGTLSRGQMYKAALCGFLAVDPELWILDEPFASGMDPTGILHFREEARKAARAGRTIIFSTQILEIAEKFADLICILDHGRMLYVDSPANLREQSGGSDRAMIKLFQKLRSESGAE